MTSAAPEVRPPSLDPRRAKAAERRERELRCADWRFLLPPAPAGGFEHLVLLDGRSALVELVQRSGIARRVSTSPLAGPEADVVVRLHDASQDLAAAAGCLAPGGVLYFEIHRVRPGWEAMTPSRVREELERLGLTPLDIYWVRDSFSNRRVYLPTDCPAAIAWYFSRARYCGNRVQRLGALSLPIVARLGGQRLLARRIYTIAVVAARGTPRVPGPCVLAIPELKSELRDPRLRSIVFTPRLQRVVVLPFAPGGTVPLAVIKVARFSRLNVRTDHEQAVLADIRRPLDDRLRRTVPEPLGVHRAGELAVGVESYVRGRLLGRSRELWVKWRARRHFRDLRAVARWLADFHRQTTLRSQRWDEAAAAGLDATMAEYGQTFGLTGEEGALFAETRALSRSLLGVPIPRVWRHCDLTPRNTSRTTAGIAVIDWEHGREGYPLLDLLHFVEEWLYNNAPDAPHLVDKVRRFHQVFVLADVRDPWSRVVLTSIRAYMARLDLDVRLFPLLHVLLRVERAVTRFTASDDPDTDRIALEMVERYVAYVRALAAGAHTPMPSVAADGVD
jgi:thiamine kinase-like enzyme